MKLHGFAALVSLFSPAKSAGAMVTLLRQGFVGSVQRLPPRANARSPLRRRMIFGSGILKGMLVTLKNLVASYYKKPEEGGLFTVEYPEQRITEAENFRSFPVLIYDKTPDSPRCTACDICAKECPPKCIYIVKDTGPDGKPLNRPAVFDIDLAICMSCGICEEVCPFDSIYLDHQFEMAARIREKLLVHKNDLLKSNGYLHKVRPELAKAVDAKRLEAEEKKKAVAGGQNKPG